MPTFRNTIAFIALTAALLPGGGALADAPQGSPAASGSSANGPKLTKAPKLIKFVEAPYPEEEKAHGQTAAVVLKLGITAAGTVEQVAIAESAGLAFDAAATVAAKQFLFEPAEIDGQPAAIRILYRYEFVIKEDKPATIFAGTVSDRKKKVPLPGVVVEMDSGEKVSTDAQGKFRFENLPPGKHTVSLSGEKLTGLRTEEVLEEGKQLEATYQVELQDEAAAGEQDDLEIVIVAPALQKQTVATTITADQGRKLPGTQGDVLKVVESMPGVARASAGSGQLVVWGAAPGDTRVYVEGVRIPSLYHNGGVRSVIHSDMVQSVELVPGGYAAPFGRGLGGLLNVRLRPIEGDRPHGSVNVDVLDSSLALRAPLTDKLAAGVAFRFGYLDRVLSQVTSKDVGDFFPIPRYWDGQARVIYNLSDRETVQVGGLLSSDRIERTVPSPDPAEVKRETQTLSFGRIFGQYKRRDADGSEVVATPWVGKDSSNVTNRFGPVGTSLAADTTLYGLRLSHHSKPLGILATTVGLDVEIEHTGLERTGSINSPAREGDVRVFGQAPSDQINTDRWEVIAGSAAPFIELDLSPLGEDFHLLPGLRLDPYFVSVNHRAPVRGDEASLGLFDMKLFVEPRVALEYALSPRVNAKAAWGLYHQAPAPEDRSAVFGNPALQDATAQHWLMGMQFRLSEQISEEMTFFYSSSSGLAVRNSAPTLPAAEALVATGSGRVFGGQVLIRKEMSQRLFGWLSYTLLRSERAPDADGHYRLFDFDQTHVLTAVASYDLGYDIELGTRVRYASGYPRTPVTGTYYDAASDSVSPRFGPQNSVRIPSFFQVDMRLSKRFNIAGTVLEAYLDVQNVTGRNNPEEIVYSPDYRQRRYISGLPTLPVLGARWTW